MLMGFKAVTIGGAGFWSSVSAPGDVYNDGDLLYLVLDDSARMDLVRRTTADLFTNTATAASGKGYAVIINGLMYTVTSSFITYRLGSDPIDPSDVSPDGQLVESSTVVAGRSASSMFYIAQGSGPGFAYSFGSGDPASASPKPVTAMGGLGPLIIGGLKYGDGNLYKPGTPAGPATGDPGPSFASSLVQRNNKTYKAMSDRGAAVGKVAVAHCSAKKKLLVLGHRDGAPTGITLDSLRDKLFGVGVEDAAFLDGSDSATILVKGLYLAFPGKNKNRSIPAGLGFRA